jgi:hypothetical protein
MRAAHFAGMRKKIPMIDFSTHYHLTNNKNGTHIALS